MASPPEITRCGSPEVGRVLAPADASTGGLRAAAKAAAGLGDSLQDLGFELSQLLDLLPGAVYVCGRDGQILWHNRCTTELWGRTPRLRDPGDRFCGSHRMYRMDGTPLPHTECPMADVLRTGSPVRNQEVMIERPDGARIVALVNIDALRNHAGQVVGAVNCFRDITEHRRLQEIERQSERRSHELLRLLPAAIYTTDAEGRITFYNEAAADLWGDRPELGKSEFCGSWKMYRPDGRPLPHDEWPMAVALREKRPLSGVEAVAERPDRTTIAFSAHPTPLFDGSGVLVGAVNVLVDITARRKAELDLLEQSRRLEALDRIAPAIASNLDLKSIVQSVTDAATELSGAEFGAFFCNELDEQGERYALYTLSGAPAAAFEKLGLPSNTAVFEPTFRGEGVVRADDIRKDPRYGLNAPHHGIPEGHLPVVSYLAVPVVSRSGEVHGGLFFGHQRPGVFTVESERIVTSFAAHAAIAFDNARLLQAAESELRQRREADHAAKLLASIVESSDDAIVSQDLAGTVTSWNRGAERLFGHRAEEVIGRSITIVIPPDRGDEEPAILERIRGGGQVENYETVRQCKDGSLVDVALTVSPVRDADGRLVGVSKIARDVTERRQAQEQQQLLLREMSHRVKNAFALAGSVAALSTRFARSPAEINAAIGERLGALARAHELGLPDGSDGCGRAEAPTTLDALIRTILAPYKAADDPARFAIEGRDVPVGRKAVSSLALLIQELATNAAKYGALSMPDGRVEISWSEGDEELVLTWSEHGAVGLEKPLDKEGFGSLLTRTAVTGQLQGQIAREWRPEGLRVRLSVPRHRLAQ